MLVLVVFRALGASLTFLGLLSAFCLAAGCSSDPGSQPDAGPPSIEIGTGSRDFEPLVEGATIPVITGPQGGFHLLGSLQAQNLNPGDSEDLQASSNPTTQFEIFANGVRVDAEASTYTQGLQRGDDRLEMLGRFIILDIPNATILDGMSLQFVVTVRDVDGVVVSDERNLVAQSQ
ncbi:MAG: hypothetical protein JKY56_11080 [Kofleriaceae bacterium]|nr:hypothetical protein [Kofleriaceae bacterium]